MTEDELRAEMFATDYEWTYGGDAPRIHHIDKELLHDLMRKRWRTHGLTDEERAGLERWKERTGR